MAMIPTSLATLGQIVSRLLEMYGLNAEAMLRRHGVDPVVLSKADARIPTQTWDLITREAAAQIPDPAFALNSAVHIPADRVSGRVDSDAEPKIARSRN